MEIHGRQPAPVQRIGIVTLVILLHALGLYGLANGLGQWKIAEIARVIEVTLIREPPPPPPPPRQEPPVAPAPPAPPVVEPKPAPKRRPPPPPRQPVLKPAPISRPPAPSPAIPPLPVPSPAPSPSVTAPAPAGPPAAPASAPSASAASAPHVPSRTSPVVDARNCSMPEYPTASRQFDEAGTVVLNFLIDVDGRVIQSRIESSSGYRRLDEAALRALSLCRFRPGTVDGKPEKSWHRLKYVWRLDE